jgi:hypothetical protein
MDATGLGKAEEGAEDVVIGDEGLSEGEGEAFDLSGSTTVDDEVGGGIEKGPGTEYDDRCRCWTFRQ